MADTSLGVGAQRAIALVVLLVDGVLSLPLTAAFLDGESTESFIIPVQLVGTTAIGAMVGYALPGLAGATATKARGAKVGAAVGLAAALLGLVLFFLLLSGLDGA
jgi:hypothetical protein